MNVRAVNLSSVTPSPVSAEDSSVLLETSWAPSFCPAPCPALSSSWMKLLSSLPPLFPLLCYPEARIVFKFHLLPHTHFFWDLFLCLWFHLLWRQTPNLFLQFQLLDSLLDISTQTCISSPTPSLSLLQTSPLMSHFYDSIGAFPVTQTLKFWYPFL